MLDISWNCIGQQKPGPVKPGKKETRSVGQRWGEAFEVNKTLLHLDLSFNKIGVTDTTIMAEKIRENHTIYGLHFQGNCGRVDSLGFLHVIDSFNSNLMAQNVSRQIQGVSPHMAGKKMASSPKRSAYQFDSYQQRMVRDV